MSAVYSAVFAAKSGGGGGGGISQKTSSVAVGSSVASGGRESEGRKEAVLGLIGGDAAAVRQLFRSGERRRNLKAN